MAIGMETVVSYLPDTVIKKEAFSYIEPFVPNFADAPKERRRLVREDAVEFMEVQVAEMFVLTLFSSLVLIGFGPILIANVLLNQITSTYVFPINVFPVIPWFTLLAVFLSLIVSVLAFIMIVAFWSSRVDLAASLNAAWAESSPFGGDM